MRWRNYGQSDNVEDRRGSPSGGRGLPVGKTGSVVVLLVVMVAGYYGVDLTPLLGDGSPVVPVQQQQMPSGQEEKLASLSRVVLKMTEDTWGGLFQGSGKAYHPPKMVLYSGGTDTRCGYGQATTGPFYCPGDQAVYLDVSFYEEMKRTMGGGGDFAWGYVIAHEVGHHVQHELGIDEEVRRLQSRSSERDGNHLSVMLELQADCFAGIWGKNMNEQGVLESGDLEEALSTAQAIGDDRLQKQATGHIMPDSFTHGTSAQRYTWFKRGFDSGDPKMCDTFSNLR